MAKRLNKLYIGENGKAIELVLASPPPIEILKFGDFGPTTPTLQRTNQTVWKFEDGLMTAFGQIYTPLLSWFDITFAVPFLEATPLDAIVVDVNDPPEEYPNHAVVIHQTVTGFRVNISAGGRYRQTWMWKVLGRWK